MVSGLTKRHASRSPDRERAAKRLATSSPEEGELDDATPAGKTPLNLPASLPAKPPTAKNKVAFPFKTKAETSRNGAGPTIPESTNSPAVYSRPDNDEGRHRNSDHRQRTNRRVDHWVPDYGRGDTRGDSFSSRPPPPRWEHRERVRSPPSPRSPSSRSPTTPSSNHQEKHRLPAPRSPEPGFSPLARTEGRDRRGGRWDRSRDRRREEDDRFHMPREPDPDAHRYYRPNGYRRGDHREFIRRDERDRGERRDDRYERVDYERPRRLDTYRPASPRRALTPPPAPPRECPSPDAKKPHHSKPCQPPSGPPSEAKRTTMSPPPPPSSSPPPPPPPDPRLMKNITLLHQHAPVSIPLKRPPAPKNIHSFTPLPLPPVKTEVAHDAREDKESRYRLLRKREFIRRSAEKEKEAYGHTFVGCGDQSDYSMTTKLGEGTFGEVHKAIQKGTGDAVALKRILMHNEKEGMPVTALREIKILKALKHPCIVEILDMFVVRSTAKDPLSVYMVFPYMDHDLAGLLENDRVKLQPSQIKLYMKQLLEGTEYMHRNHILHRDMKAANLLISNSGSLRIADFGLARTFDGNISRGTGDSRVKDRKYTNCVVTRWYRPPELLLGARQYGGEVDVWGIGCVLGEMFWRRPILPGTSDLDQLDKIWQLCGTPNQHTWPNFDALPGCEGVKRFHPYSRRLKQTYESIGPETCDLLDKLLTCNPRERITATQALEHDYFWTDPLPADPKTLPSYEASHEFDKRGHRNHHPPQPNPPPPPPNIHRPPRETYNKGPPRNMPGNPRGPPNGPLAGGPPMGMPHLHPHLPQPRGRGLPQHRRPPQQGPPPYPQHRQPPHPMPHRGHHYGHGDNWGGQRTSHLPPNLPPRPSVPLGLPAHPGTKPPDRTGPPHQSGGGNQELNYG